METRILGRTGRLVSVIGLGTWQLGADWGEVDPADARAVLETSLEQGITFYDTADVYGDGRSERFLGEFLAAHPDAGITVATKVGRRVPQEPRELHPRQLPLVDQPITAQSRRRHARPRAAPLPTDRGLRVGRGVRRA